jgi:hypothetical protein
MSRRPSRLGARHGRPDYDHRSRRRRRAVVADRTSRAYHPPVEIAQSRTCLSFVRYREVLSGNIAIGGLSNMVYLIARGAVIDLSGIWLT